MKTKILLPFFCLLSAVCFSQDSVFHLKDYKYRTKGYRSLEFNLSVSGNANSYKQSSLPEQEDRVLNIYPSSISYGKIFSTDKRYHSSVISLSTSYRLQMNKSGQNETKSKDYQASLNWNSEDRFYGRNNWFFQVANHLYAKEVFVKQKSTLQNVRITTPALDESLLLGFGKGRLETVQDAQMALFILNDLKEQGLIESLPSAETINQFAQLITDINNRRVFDFRRKRIYELTQMEKFLREKGISSATDIRHFTIINDNWTLAFNPYRLSGANWYLNLKSSAEIGKPKETTKDDNAATITEQYNNVLGIGPRLGYENYKPINLKWQRNFGGNVSWQTGRSKINHKTTLNGTSTETKTESKQHQTELYAFYGIGFFPNNRTKLNAAIDVRATKYQYELAAINNRTFLRPSFNFSTDYFINYRTRLYAEAYVYHEYNHYKNSSLPSYTNNESRSGFSLGISHYFL
jgi:hypothetical protein